MKRIFDFEEGDGKNKKLLGGKGAGLCSMVQMGLPVPPGFTITTEVCQEYYENGKRLPEGLMDEVREHIKNVERKTGKIFGSPERPLLVSVRSGSALSMPGMMDTILNLGLNDSTVSGLIKATGNERFAYDAYRRLIQLFCKIALKVDGELFDRALEDLKKKYNAVYDTDLSVQALKELVNTYKQICEKETGRSFPQDPYEQLEVAIKAVFESWMGKRAVDYRAIHKITPDMASGTAVNIQTMVFGNMGNDSATGVAFTRDPSTGENIFYGEYLTNAQGEDVVSGARTPKPIIKMKEELPEVFEELCKVRDILERKYREVQDFEFTIEKGKLYVLQTRDAKMNAIATIKTSLDMFREGILSKEEALCRIKPEMLEQLLHKKVDPNTKAKVIAKGISASPGAASGIATFDADEAARLGKIGKKILLVREETKPDDVHAFAVAQGILTVRGGKTSHAAVVARSMGKPCVCGAEEIKIDAQAKLFTVGGVTVKEGDIISIDGTSGLVYLGEVTMIDPSLTDELKEILRMADEIRTLGVRANADTPESAAEARRFGAEGIGLCRTERMFNAADRLPIMHKLVLAETFEERQEALSQLLPMQKEDFIKIFQVMDGLPVTVRVLDPPLHEFLPSVELLLSEIAEMRHKGSSPRELSEKEKQLRIV
ncbi:MAG: pyruvate, phosphate dikinase [Candidatus Bathyarchaeia archaeon]